MFPCRQHERVQSWGEREWSDFSTMDRFQHVKVNNWHPVWGKCVRAYSVIIPHRFSFMAGCWLTLNVWCSRAEIYIILRTQQARTKGIFVLSNGFPLSLPWSKAFVILPKMLSIKGFNQGALWYVLYPILFPRSTHSALLHWHWLNLYGSLVCGSLSLCLGGGIISHPRRSSGCMRGIIESVTTRNISFSKGQVEVNCWTFVFGLFFFSRFPVMITPVVSMLFTCMVTSKYDLELILPRETSSSNYMLIKIWALM